MNISASQANGAYHEEYFDEQWYVAEYPDVMASGLQPLEHYRKYGMRMRRKPGPAASRVSMQAPSARRDAVDSSPMGAIHPWPEAVAAPARFALPALADGGTPPREAVATVPVMEAEQEQMKASATAVINESAEPVVQVITGAASADLDMLEQLKLKLWGGYSRYAVDELEGIKTDRTAEPLVRAEAAYCLMQWFYVEGLYLRAYENVTFYTTLIDTGTDRKYLLGAILCLIKLRRYGEADRLLDAALADRSRSGIYLSDFVFLKGSVARFLSDEQTAEATQLAWFGDSFKIMGLAPVEKKNPELPLTFANLTAHAVARSGAQQSKVSIIIPTFNAESTITYAVRSLQEQTWKNIEIIIVDDCSSDATCDVVNAIAAQDSRVKLVRKQVNEGAYPARNTGLKHASGDLIMVHDSDDWSHPQKIEIQIRALMKAPQAVGVMSNWIRVDDDFMPTVHSRPRNTIKSMSFPSLLFKRKVVDEIGPWSGVRVSGDAEFKTRIERYYGKDAIAKVSKVLAISLSREDSLTQNSATHINTLHFGLRWQYLSLYNYFHDRQVAFDPASRECAVMTKSVIGNRSTRQRGQPRFDYIFVADFVDDSATIAYVRLACRAGRKVAVYHWRHYDMDMSLRIDPALYDLCLEHEVEILTCSDEAETDCVVFGDVALLRRIQDRFPAIATGCAVGWLRPATLKSANRAAGATDFIGEKAIMQALFGTTPHLIPASPRFVLHETIRTGCNVPYLPPAIDLALAKDHESAWRGEAQAAPVVGVVGGAIDADKLARIGWRPMQGALEAEGAHSSRGMKPRYQLLPVEEKKPSRLSKAALASLDFLIYYPEEDCFDEFDAGIIEAMAAGVPVILPHELEASFSKAALYAAWLELEKTVMQAWTSKPLYLERVAAGKAYVREQLDFTKIDKALRSLPGSSHSQAPGAIKPTLRRMEGNREVID